MEFTSLEKAAAVLIGCIIFYFVKFVSSIVFTYLVGPTVNKVDYPSMGKWALVTGCTDGIGKQYAEQLASRGCNIVLVSRSLDKLKTTAEEIEKKFGVSTKTIQVDFCSDEKIYEKIGNEIAGLEIGTLVNNVGVSYTYPEYFLDIPDWEQTVSNMIKANVVAVTKMTNLVLPQMVQRKKGVVINIGSASSIIPSPLLTVYAATKAYVDKFTDGIEMEYSKRGIIFQCVLPGFVCSNMSGIKRSSFLAPAAKVFVHAALSLVGTESKTTGYIPHAIFVNVLNTIQDTSKTFSTWLVTRTMETNRLKVLKKYKKQ